MQRRLGRSKQAMRSATSTMSSTTTAAAATARPPGATDATAGALTDHRRQRRDDHNHGHRPGRTHETVRRRWRIVGDRRGRDADIRNVSALRHRDGRHDGGRHDSGNNDGRR